MRWLRDSKTHRKEVSDEVVDVLYLVRLIAKDFDIDLDMSSGKLLENAAKYPIEKSKGRHAKYTELAE